jgi:hypothetical protein
MFILNRIPTIEQLNAMGLFYRQISGLDRLAVDGENTRHDRFDQLVRQAPCMAAKTLQKTM